MGRESTTSQPTTKPTQKACKNCGRATKQRRNRCGGCEKYYRSHGVERPSHLYTRVCQGDLANAPLWCDVCGNTTIYRGRKCRACYEYQRINKKRRPRHLWDDEAKCKTCGVPLSSQGTHKGNRRRQCSGHCLACYQYIHDHGHDRRRHLWGIGEHGWCECGRPATALADSDIPVCNIHKE